MPNNYDNVTVAALYVDLNGPYPALPNVDCWDEERDARKYEGNNSVVAHPPCNRWGKLAPVNQKRWGTPIGEDGGCFEHALKTVRRCGGVLEHPASTIAWRTFGLTKPTKLRWEKVDDNEWVAEVWQSAYGHKATKRTWLLYVGNNDPIPFNDERVPGKYQVGGGVHRNNNKKPRLNPNEAHLTPPLFAEYLVNLARKARHEG